MEIIEKKKILLQYIKKFRQLSEFLNNCLINHYDLKCSNLLFDILDDNEKTIVASKRKIIPKNSIIELERETIKYSFHGIGCYFEYCEQIIDFNYYPKIDEKVVFLFSTNKIYDFLSSKKDTISWNKEDILFLLEELNAVGLIESVINGGYHLYYLKN